MAHHVAKPSFRSRLLSQDLRKNALVLASGVALGAVAFCLTRNPAFAGVVGLVWFLWGVAPKD